MSDTTFRQYDPRYPLLARAREPYREPLYVASEETTMGFSTVEMPAAQEVSPIQTTDEDPRRRRRRNITIWIIVAIILLILIAVAVWYFFFRNRSTTNTNTPATGSLNDTCSATSPCLVLFSCDSGKCKSILNGPCISNTDCSQAQFTQVCTGTGGQAGQCRRPNSGPCGAPGECASGFCSSNTCTACANNGDCQTGQTCSGGICA